MPPKNSSNLQTSSQQRNSKLFKFPDTFELLHFEGKIYFLSTLSRRIASLPTFNSTNDKSHFAFRIQNDILLEEDIPSETYRVRDIQFSRLSSLSLFSLFLTRCGCLIKFHVAGAFLPKYFPVWSRNGESTWANTRRERETTRGGKNSTSKYSCCFLWYVDQRIQLIRTVSSAGNCLRPIDFPTRVLSPFPRRHADGGWPVENWSRSNFSTRNHPSVGCLCRIITDLRSLIRFARVKMKRSMRRLLRSYTKASNSLMLGD